MQLVEVVVMVVVIRGGVSAILVGLCVKTFDIISLRYGYARVSVSCEFWRVG